MENKRLVTNLIDIEKNYNIYGKKVTKRKLKLPKTLKSDYEEYSKSVRISLDNHNLFTRIKHIEPEVCSASEIKLRKKRQNKLQKIARNPI